MSLESKAKPKFKTVDLGNFWDTRVLDYFESAHSCFVVLHPFYKLTPSNFALLEVDDIQLFDSNDQELADKVEWQDVEQRFGVPDHSALRALIFGQIHGLNPAPRQKEFSTFLCANTLVCPQNDSAPAVFEALFLDAIRNTGGEKRILENTNIVYSSNGDLIFFCPREELCTYIAGERQTIESVLSEYTFEGFWVSNETTFNW